MGYKLIGLIVIRGGSWYLRRRLRAGAPGKLTVGGLASLALARGLAARRGGRRR
jgi:hypothetical protein